MLNYKIYKDFYLLYIPMRPRLNEKYVKEREDVCNKIIAALDLDENKTFVLHELDTNEEKQNNIMRIKDEAQQYFACSNVAAYKPNAVCKRPYLSVVRSILRKQGYIFIGNDYTIKESKIKTIRYFIFRDNN